MAANGVPNLLIPLPAAAPVTLLTADTAGSLASFGAPQWGLFLNGALVVSADSVVAFEFKQEYAISDYQVEEGAFESYNKVQIPFDVRLTFTAGGSLANREGLLNSIAAIIGDLNFYTAMTPEVAYPSVNLVHWDYKRTATNGLGLMQVNVWCEQVMVNVGSGGLTNTAAPSGATQQNNGTVQPTTPTSTQTTQITAVG